VNKKKPRAKNVKTHALSTPRFLNLKGKDPSKEYRFVKKDDGSVGLREQVGWIVSQDENLTGPKHLGGSTTETNDLVLMEIDKDLHEQIKAIPGKRSRARVNGVISDGGENMGSKVQIAKPDRDLQNSQETDNIFED
jgi:hypothetical protein